MHVILQEWPNCYSQYKSQKEKVDTNKRAKLLFNDKKEISSINHTTHTTDVININTVFIYSIKIYQLGLNYMRK